MSTDNPNPPKAAPTHEEMLAIYADRARDKNSHIVAAQTLAYIEAAEAKDARIAKLDDTLTMLRGVLECGPGDEVAQARLAKKRIAELEREAATLRDRLRRAELMETPFR